MEANLLEEELHKYWALLTISQKEFVIDGIRSLIKQPKRISIEDYNRELDEAMENIKNGEFYTHEEVIKMSKEW